MIIDILNWPDPDGLKLIHLILLAVAVLAGRGLWKDFRTLRRLRVKQYPETLKTDEVKNDN